MRGGSFKILSIYRERNEGCCFQCSFSCASGVKVSMRPAKYAALSAAE